MDVGAPAVVAAIADATGAWIHDLPASPERILAAWPGVARGRRRAAARAPRSPAAGRQMTRYRFTVNAAPVEVDVPGMRRLLDVLREDLALTGTKEGCGEGECGACTVLLDGAPVDSCLVPVCQVEGAERPHGRGPRPGLRRRTARRSSTPCRRRSWPPAAPSAGSARPGMLMAGAAYLDAGGGPDEDAIREAIAGNLCRCTGYTKIVEAIAMAAGGQR